MNRESSAGRGVVIIAVLLIGASMVVFATDAQIIATTPSSQSTGLTTSASTGSNSTSAQSVTTSNSSASSASSPAVPTISFSSPRSGSVFSTGQSITIAGAITPAPTSPDRVIIEANELDSMPVIRGAIVPVATSGAFSFTDTVGSGWASGVYTITVTDLNGLTGYWSFTVQNATA